MIGVFRSHRTNDLFNGRERSCCYYLDIANIGGTYVIRAFDSGLLGESFSFGVTKSVKNKALSASSEPAMAVPVSMAAGS